MMFFRVRVLRPRRSAIGLLIVEAALISIVSASLAWQNVQASALLRAARFDISKGSYSQAWVALKRAQSYYATTSTRRQIRELYKQDIVWATDVQYMAAATALETIGQYHAAASVLAQIDLTFPELGQTTALGIRLHAELASAAQAPIAASAQSPQTTTPATVVKPPTAKSKPNPVPIVTTPGKRFTSTAASASLAAATSVASAQQALQTFAAQYHLNLEVGSLSPSTYASQFDTYTLLTSSDLPTLKTYGSLFIDEWAKYPTDWVAASRLQSVALVKNLAVGGTHRAAAPDPFGETMYYDVTYSGDYAREVLHHEFDHLITYNDFGSWAPSDPTWQSYNPPGFSYGNGGASCYQPGNNCLAGEHPIAGFVSGYAASGIEEDKAELYAYLMTGTYYHLLESWLSSDPYLAKKVNNYKGFIASHSPEMAGSYFNDIDP